jgi:hypothetical protein
MRKLPTAALLSLVWLGVVVVVSAVTWTVIDSAGQEILTSGGPRSLPAAGVAGSPQPAGSPGPPRSPGRHRTHGPRGTAPSPTPSAQRSDHVGPGVATPRATPTPATPSSRASSVPGTAPSTRPVPAPAQVRTWQGQAGTVTARCQGARISLQSATPDDGWAVRVDSRGTTAVQVRFTTGGDDDRERETLLSGTCSSGAPRFAVAADGGSRDG